MVIILTFAIQILLCLSQERCTILFAQTPQFPVPQVLKPVTNWPSSSMFMQSMCRQGSADWSLENQGLK